MKTLLKLSILLICILPLSCFAQRNWGNWVQLYNYEGQTCSVSFNTTSNCNNFSYSFFRTDNNIVYDKGFIGYSFKYYDCSGQQQTQRGSINLGNSGIDEDKGQWFLTRGGTISDIEADEVFIPSKKIWLKRVDDRMIDYWKQRYGN